MSISPDKTSEQPTDERDTRTEGIAACKSQVRRWHAADELLSSVNAPDLADLTDSEVKALQALDLYDDDVMGLDPESLTERIRETIQEEPLAIESWKVFRVDLSTGGPGTWIEIKCSGEEHYEIEAVTFVYVDWHGRYEQSLEGDDLKAAEAFAREVVADLIE